MPTRFRSHSYRPRNAKADRQYVLIDVEGMSKAVWLPLPAAQAIVGNPEAFAEATAEAEALVPAPPVAAQPAEVASQPAEVASLAQALASMQATLAALTGASPQPAKQPAKTKQPAPLSGAAARVRSARR